MKVKVRMKFKGREITHPEIGRERLDKIAEELSDIAIIEQHPNLEGRAMLMVLAPNSEKK
jgi:translation initiation factor IF-3